MNTPTPSIPGVDRDALAAAIHRDTVASRWLAGPAADAALAHIAAHQEPRACACGAKYDRCPACAADDAYEEGRKDAACDREHADEWVEVDGATWEALPKGARRRREWVVGVFDGGRRFVHRDDLPADPRALIARELGAGRADTFLGLLDEHGWTVTRKGER